MEEFLQVRNKEACKRVRCGEDNLTVSELPTKKKGRLLLLGKELEEQVRAYLTSLRENGAVVNTAILIACAEGIVKTKDCKICLPVMVDTFL